MITNNPNSIFKRSLWNITRVTLAAFVISTTAASAQNAPSVWGDNQLYKPPFDLQAPGNRNQGGTRAGREQEFTQKLTALVPQPYNFGVTTEAYPSFLVQAPMLEENPDLETLEFLLLDAEGEEIYRAKFEAEVQNSVLRIDLPKHAGLTELEEGKDYLWILEGFTKDFTLSNDLVAHGWIRRVPPTEKLMASLNSSTSVEEIAKAYIDEQIWYDAIASLEAGLQDENAPKQLLEQWDTLLKSAGIGAEVVNSEAVDTEEMIRQPSIEPIQ